MVYLIELMFMEKNFKRQLKDIQNEASKLLSERPSQVDIKNFQKYSGEMVKSFRLVTLNAANEQVL